MKTFDEEIFEPIRDLTSDSTAEGNITDNSNEIVTGEFSSQEVTGSYEFKPHGYSRVLLKKNGEVLFDGTAEEFKQFRSESRNPKDAFITGFNDGRSQAKSDFPDNFDIDIKTVNKAKRSCSLGCLVSLLVTLLILAVFGAGIYHIVLGIIEALK